MKNNCTVTNNNKLIIFQEKRSKLTIINTDQAIASKITVDGCEITEGLRCDFLLLAKEMEYFIELKGTDLNHAMEQLKRTILLLSDDSKIKRKISFIICTRSPLTSASIQHYKVIFRKKFNSDLIVKKSGFSYNI